MFRAAVGVLGAKGKKEGGLPCNRFVRGSKQRATQHAAGVAAAQGALDLNEDTVKKREDRHMLQYDKEGQRPGRLHQGAARRSGACVRACGDVVGWLGAVR